MTKIVIPLSAFILLRGVQGELYVIKKDIFEQTYDEIG